MSGLYGGRSLKSPPSPTRPTQDRVRQILFDIIGARIEGGAALDLYAGSGALGLEALSRGASRVVFVERAERVRRVLIENLRALGVDAEAEVIARPVEAALPDLVATGSSFRWILADPPYEGGAALAILKWLGGDGRPLLEPAGGLVLETSRDEPLPETQGSMVRYRQRPVGGTNLHFYRGEEPCA